MRKVSVLASKSDMEKVIDVLHDRKAYHIVQHDASEIDIGSPLATSEDIDEALVSATSLLSEWELEGDVKDTPTVKQAIKKIQRVSRKHRKNFDKEKEILEQKAELEEKLTAEKVLDDLGLDKKYINGLESVKGFAGTYDGSKLEESISNVTKDFEIEQNNGSAVVFVPRDEADEIEKTLQSIGFSFADVKEAGTLKKLKSEVKKLDKELSQLRKDEEELKKEFSQDIIDSEKVLKEASEKSEAPLSFAVSENVFYVEGYVPVDKFSGLEEELNEKTKNRIDFRELPLGDENEVPIEMEHTKPVQPFEFFMDLYSLPKYAELDPTVLTFITFPILFGFMLGDMGYGVTTLIAFLIMKKALPSMKRLINILISASIWTIIFGLMFGEVFGEEVLFGFHFPHILSRLHDVNDLLLLSLAVGVVHINLGLLLGFYNELKAHGLKAALLEKGGWFVLQAAAVLFGLNMFRGLNIYYGIAALAVSIVIIYKGEGIKGIIELPALFSNILSYARLMAIAMASAGLAVVVNQFAKDFFAQGASGIIPGVLILIVGHFINILLGLFGPFLHSLRLHYVEFFTKFFKGGGKPFEPFGGR